MSDLSHHDVDVIYQSIHQLISDAKHSLQQTVNRTLTMTYWYIGRELTVKLSNNKSGELVNDLVYSVSRLLVAQHGKGFTRANLFHFMRFYAVYPDEKRLYSLSRLISWTHFRSLIYIDDPTERDFYTELCEHENWSTRVLRERISSQLFKRTALSQEPEVAIKAELEALASGKPISPKMVLRDPYVLDFLQLPSSYSESDLEQAILNELTQFLQELGSDFCFVARQKRISIGKKDHYLDLLFFHRRLKRLIAIELKLDDFQPAHKGQMELYVRWLDKYEKCPGEARPIGIILCAGKDQDEIELLGLDDGDIHVAEYLTELPNQALLQERLQRAITSAKERFAEQSYEENTI